ncbi:hypothetical protein, partial [Bacillus smithii]|uniref:hypothetical protein n=1 Tax=Bacillus smithii TaxID=1479 RepID=UPI003D24F1F7
MLRPLKVQLIGGWMYGSVLKEQLVATKKVNWKWKKEALTVFHLLGRLKNGKENDSFPFSLCAPGM